MSAGVVQRWRSQMEAGERRNWDEVISNFDPNCEWTLVTSSKTFRGHTELLQFFQSGFGASLTREKPDIKAEFGTDEWGVFEYVSRGRVSKEALQFTEVVGASQVNFITRFGKTLGAFFFRLFFAGKTFEVPVCFIYHVNGQGLIDCVHEYAATHR
jgi:hypothetical protein